MLEGTSVREGWTLRAAPAEGTAGDAALERVVREHSRLVYRVAFAILRNRQDAEDATQEAFLRVLRLRRELDGVVDPKGWLARVAYRVAVDRRRRGTPLSLGDEAVSSEAAAVRAADAGADDVAASLQVRALLATAIAALPDDLRHVVQLSTVEELTSAEIGRLVGIPEGTVRTRLLRARALLREALSPALGARHG